MKEIRIVNFDEEGLKLFVGGASSLISRLEISQYQHAYNCS